MIRAYVGPISQGLGIFVVLAALGWLPYLIWQYRRYGRVGMRRVLTNGTFALYLICAWALVLLPLPDPASVQKPTPVNLVPFQWWPDVADAAAKAGGGWRAWLLNGPLLVRVFNVVLTVPLGLYLRRWYRRGFWITTLSGLALSLAFELTQLTGIWGIYPVRYRSFDVDDLIANTAGAALGWMFAPLVGLLPQRHSDDDRVFTGRPGLGRRAVALIIDVICWALSYLVALFGLAAVTSRLGVASETVAAGLWSLTFAAIFVLVPSYAGGASPGRALLGLGVRRPDGTRVAAWRYLVRELVLWLPVIAALLLAGSVSASSAVRLAIVAGVPLAWAGLLAVIALVRSDGRSLPDLAAGTEVFVA